MKLPFVPAGLKSLLIALSTLAGLMSVAHAAPLSLQPLLSGKWPATPRLGGAAGDVAVSGNYAYLAIFEGGLLIFDVSNPAAAVRVGACDTPGYTAGVAVSGNCAYLVDGNLHVIGVSDPARCVRVGGAATGSGRASGVAVSGHYAYVASDALGLEVYDVSDPANPARVGGYRAPDSQAFNVAVSGDFAYLAYSGRGLHIINVSDPANPTLAGISTVPGYAYDVALSGNLAYVAASEGGLADHQREQPGQLRARGQLHPARLCAQRGVVRLARLRAPH